MHFSLPRRSLPLLYAGFALVTGLITGLITSPVVQAQTIEPIDIDGTRVNLVIPAGYCKLDRAAGRSVYDLQDRMNAGVNRVLLLFIECNQLKRAMADPKVRYTHHGSYLAPLEKGVRATKIPANMGRQQALDEMSKAIPAMDADTVQGKVNERTGSEGVAISKMSTGLLTRDANAAYVGMGMSATVPQSPAKKTAPERIRGVIFITVLKGVAVTGNLYAPVEPGAPFDKLLAQQKANAAAVVKAN